MVKKNYNDEKDDFGFQEDYQFDRETSESLKPKNIKNIILYILLGLVLVLYLLFVILSGYIAWNSVTNDPISIKLLKTYMAVLFAPIYISYIF